MAIQIGTKVEVVFPSRNQRFDPAYKLHGKQFVVSKVRYLSLSRTDRKAIYELYGAKSKYGIPYSFAEENLRVVKEGDK